MTGYVDALVKEMEIAAAAYEVKAKTIFIGGGTPSCLEESLLEIVLQAVQKYFGSEALVEYTMEANPGTLSAEKLALMRKYGVNRLSLGVQSDRADHLKMLGRIHSFDEARQAVELARAAGFENINLDFMYGLPGQTAEQWSETLVNAIRLNPQHLSLYQLKIEEGTAMYQWLEDGKISEFDDEQALAMYRIAQHVLAEHGYGQYEISNYAQPGRESLHNQVYWRTENYLGVGLGACSWVRPLRWNNQFEMNDYIGLVQTGQLPGQAPEHLTETEQMEETVFMALRMNQGLSKHLFSERFAKPAEAVFADALRRCMEKGWIKETEDAYCLTEEGRVLGNLVFMEFIQ
jgi:oxygen-independent coproporphyrinogen-3 oxidase